MYLDPVLQLRHIKDFWCQFPALFYGVSFLFGVYASFYFSWELAFILCLFWIPLLPPISKTVPFLSFAIFTAAFLYTSSINQHPSILNQGVKGSILFQTTNLTHKQSSMGSSWNYQGKILHFKPEDLSNPPYINIPATIILRDKDSIKRPIADSIFSLQGTLKKTKNGRYIFHPQKDRPWQLFSDRWNFTEWRFNAKQRVNRYIKEKYPHEPSKSFLAGIVTGDFENRLLSFEFARFGLQHIMAISGFHFSIVATILGVIFTCLVGRKIAFVALMVALSLYFFFLGTAPSIIRAWISCMIAFSAFLFEKQPSGLNSLGLGLFAVLIFDPELALHIGFQFSFAVTAAILVFFSPADNFLQILMPKRNLTRLAAMNRLNQHGFIVLSLFRQALALTLAVNLVALPITLYYFQTFPLMSLLYNLFFPGLVSFSMLLLIFGVSFDLIHSWPGHFFHQMNDMFTQFMLDYTYAMPRSVDLKLDATISHELLVLFLGVYFTIGIVLNRTSQPEIS